MLLPFSSQPLPDAPSLGAVLMRSMLANRNEFERHLQPSDLLMVPPLPAGMSILDWGRHGELMTRAHSWGLTEVDRLREDGHSALTRFQASAAIVPARR
jgi:hypothetical protein